MNAIMNLISKIAPVAIESLPHVTSAQDINRATVYKFDVTNGDAAETVMNCDIGKTNKEAFVTECVRVWYGLEVLKISADAERIRARIDKALEARDKEQDAKNGTETPVLTAEERAACIAAKARIDANEKALAYHLRNVARPKVYAANLTVRTFVQVMRKDRLTEADLTLFDGVWLAAKSLIAEGHDAEEERAVKMLRPEIEASARAIWKPDEGLVEPYDIYCGARLAKAVYKVLYKGLSVNRKSGDIQARNARPADVIREIVLAIFEDLQTKNATRRAETKPAPDAVTTAPADKPKTADKPKRERNHTRRSKTTTDSNPAPAPIADSTPNTTPDVKTA